jgi:hypothetical protein
MQKLFEAEELELSVELIDEQFLEEAAPQPKKSVGFMELPKVKPKQEPRKYRVKRSINRMINLDKLLKNAQYVESKNDEGEFTKFNLVPTLEADVDVKAMVYHNQFILNMRSQQNEKSRQSNL